MEVRLSKSINAPIEKVFDVFSDIGQIENRISGITKIEILSDVKSGAGTRWRETRVMFGREATEEMEISALEANKSYDVVAESRGMKYHTQYTFSPQGDGTQVEMVFSGQAVSLVAKMMTPLAYLMKGTIHKAMDKDMDELKAVCEDGQ